MPERRDKKHRVLRRGESVRKDGKYQFKYIVDGKPRFIYSWRLEETDSLPKGRKPCLSLREMEKTIRRDAESGIRLVGGKTTVLELVERYLKTRTGVRPNTRLNYNTALNALKKEEFSEKAIRDVRTSDAKLFLIKLQNDGRGYSSVAHIRGILRPAFQMAVDDDILVKNPFAFELMGVVVNDSVTREAISREDMRRFLKFVHDDTVYCKYYEVVYILFHTGMRISEFCGLTLKDINFDENIIDINHQLVRVNMVLHVEPTKTNAGTRKIPMTEDVRAAFRAIIDDRDILVEEKMIDGYSGFLFLDKEGLPLVALHWQHRFNNMVDRFNSIYRLQIPNITPHVCRHTYCSNMARSGMNPKTLQYLMGHSDISVTMNTYTHLGLDDARDEMIRLEELEKARGEVEKTTSGVNTEMFRVG